MVNRASSSVLGTGTDAGPRPAQRRRRGGRVGRGLAALFALSLFGAPPALAQDRPIDSETAARAAQHYKTGVALVAAGKGEWALDSLREAYRLDPRPAAYAGNLGTLEFHLGHHREAAEHLAEALQRLEKTAAKEKFDALASLLTAAEAEVGRVRVRVDTRAELSVDGTSVGPVERERTTYVAPGQRVVLTVSARGYRTARFEVEVAKGGQRDVTLHLELEPAPVPIVSPSTTADSVEPVEPAQPGERNRLPLVVGGALAVTAAGIGVGFLVHGANLSDDAETIRNEIRAEAGTLDGYCAEPIPADHTANCGRLFETVYDQNDAMHMATGFFIGAGVAAAAGVAVYFLLPRQGAAPVASVAIAPSVGAGMRGLSIAGTFW